MTLARTAVAIGGCILVALLLWHPAPRPPAWSSLPPPPAIPSADPRQRTSAVPATVVVYVVGAVRRPGLYSLPPGARAAEAVDRAGGMTAAADPAAVNLAARLADGEEVEVPRIGQAATAPVATGGHPPRGRVARPRRRRTIAASPAPSAVDVNAASVDELAAVPGIGRAIAQRIVALRERDGSFASLDELLDVSGMSAARLARAEQYLHPP